MRMVEEFIVYKCGIGYEVSRQNFLLITSRVFAISNKYKKTEYVCVNRSYFLRFCTFFVEGGLLYMLGA